MKNKHLICGYIGQTGSGKTYKMKKDIKRFNRIISFDPEAQLTDLFFPVNSIREFAKFLDQKKTQFKINCVFEDLFEYSLAFNIIWRFCQNIVLAIDEVSNFSSNWNEDENLTKIITRGRLKNISLFWTSQRPALVSKTLTSQSHKIYAFRLLDFSDLNFVPGRFRDKSYQEKFNKLKTGEYILIRGEEN